MPFTLAHPVAVFPLWQLTRKKLDLPALMVGAMMPDVSYFVALHPVSNIGHSMAGVFLEGIPSGLVLLLVGRYLLWRPVLSLLPNSVSDRIAPSDYTFWTVPRLASIVLSLFIGALTHIGWDSFTHQRGWGVQRIGWLSNELLGLSAYKWLQYGGGITGLLLLAFIAFNALQALQPQYQHPKISMAQRAASILLIAVTTGWVVLLAFTAEPATEGLRDIVIRSVVGVVSGTFVGFCLYAVLFWMVNAFSGAAER